MSWGVWLHLSESSQELVSNDVAVGKCSCLSINLNPCWACAIYFWSFVMSVGRDRKIDVYPVSIKEKRIGGFICQLFFRNPIPIISPISLSFHHIASHLHLFTLSLLAEIHSDITTVVSSFHIWLSSWAKNILLHGQVNQNLNIVQAKCFIEV